MTLRAFLKQLFDFNKLEIGVKNQFSYFKQLNEKNNIVFFLGIRYMANKSKPGINTSLNVTTVTKKLITLKRILYRNVII